MKQLLHANRKLSCADLRMVAAMPFKWQNRAMKAAMDAAGRVVIPKALRLTLGFKPGQVLEARVTDGRLEIEAMPTPMKLRKRGKGVVAVPEEQLPTLTEDQVRETIERVRR